MKIKKLSAYKLLYDIQQSVKRLLKNQKTLKIL